MDSFHAKFEEEFVSMKSDTLSQDSKLYKDLKKLFTPDVRKLEKFLGYKTHWFDK